MNPRMKSLAGGRAVWFCVLMGVLPIAAAQTNGPAVTPPLVPRSTFIQPANAKEGRDPFFPLSLRPYASAVVPTANTTDLSALAIQGMSGSPDHRLVIINNVTFAVGDEAEVITPQGRIRIHCLEITGNSAVVEANGQRQQLHYGLKP